MFPPTGNPAHESVIHFTLPVGPVPAGNSASYG